MASLIQFIRAAKTKKVAESNAPHWKVAGKWLESCWKVVGKWLESGWKVVGNTSDLAKVPGSHSNRQPRKMQVKNVLIPI
jgi:hypothetical protein